MKPNTDVKVTVDMMQRILDVDIPSDKKMEILAILSGKKPRSKAAIRQERYMAAKKAKEIADAENESRFDAVNYQPGDAESPPLSPEPPIPTRTHTPACEDPCTLEEAQTFARNNGIAMTPDGVRIWHDARSNDRWMIHRNNGTSDVIPEWKKDIRNSVTWVRAKQADLQTKELRLQRELSFAANGSKPKSKYL